MNIYQTPRIATYWSQVKDHEHTQNGEELTVSFDVYTDICLADGQVVGITTDNERAVNEYGNEVVLVGFKPDWRDLHEADRQRILEETHE